MTNDCGNPTPGQGQMLDAHLLKTGSNYFWVYQYQKSPLEVNLSILDGTLWDGVRLHATKPGRKHAPSALKPPTDIQFRGPD